MKYIKNPVTVDAWTVTDLIRRWQTQGRDGLPESVVDAYDRGILDFPSGYLGESPDIERLEVVTPHGLVVAQHGSWIVRGIEGEFYPVKNDIFVTTYTPLNQPRPKYPYSINEMR